MLDWIKRHRLYLLLAAIVALGAFMRFYKLDVLPPGLHPDEAANGLDIFKILEQHDFRPFYSANGGREALFFYLQAIGVLLFDNTILGLRVAPALIGTLSVLAVYLWASSWFNRRTGLIAALLMAVTPWAVIISRDGFRASMVMLMIPLTLWLLTKGFQTRKTLWYVLGGISLGAGFYTYIAFRLFPVALLVAAVYVLIWRRSWVRAAFKPLLITGIATAVTLLPLGIYALQHPDEIAGRPGGVSIFNPDLNKGNLIGTAADTTAKTLLMFNFHGDENYRHNLGGQPQLNIFVGIMFLLGLFVAITRVRRLAYVTLLAVLVSMLLPAILTAEGIPHALRSVGAAAPALVLAAVGINYMLRQWNGMFPLNAAGRMSGTVAIVLLLGLTVVHGYTQYFVAWANAQETYDSYSEDAVSLAKYFNGSVFDGKRYVISGGYGVHPTEYLTHGKSSYERVEPSQVEEIPLSAGTPKEFAILDVDKAKALPVLQTKFPEGRLSPHYSTFSGKELFVVYTVAK